MARSGREPRYLPSESYLGQNDDKIMIMMILSPVHLPMIATGTPTRERDGDEAGLVGDCTGSSSTTLKSQLCPNYNY